MTSQAVTVLHLIMSCLICTHIDHILLFLSAYIRLCMRKKKEFSLTRHMCFNYRMQIELSPTYINTMNIIKCLFGNFCLSFTNMRRKSLLMYSNIQCTMPIFTYVLNVTLVSVGSLNGFKKTRTHAISWIRLLNK